MQMQAAEMIVQGTRFAIVLSSMDLVKSPAEADMAIERLNPQFSGARVVLMAQNDQGAPTYYGDPDIVALLAGVTIDTMPWREVSIR